LDINTNVFQLPDDNWFQQYLGCSYHDAKTVGKMKFQQFTKNRFGRSVLGPPGTVLIYKSAKQEGLSSKNGFFKIVHGSHRMTAREIQQQRSEEVTLGPADTLFIVANNTVEHVSNGHGIALQDGIYTSL
jgi:hypothetical protein